jgi:lactoylglutathione lyase
MRRLAVLAAAFLGWTAHAAQQVVLPAFDHVAINVADQQRSVDFYRGAFGLREIAAPFPAGGPRWLEMAGGISLHIQRLAEKPAPPPRAVHFALSVADLAPTLAYLDSHGITWTDSEGRPGKVQAVRTDGVRQIYVQDPDGYWIEVNDKMKAR